jgi:hypothetical protein
MKPFFRTVVTSCVTVPERAEWAVHMQYSEWNTQPKSKEN